MKLKRKAKQVAQEIFMVRLTAEEWNRPQSVTGSQKHRDPRYTPRAFTQEGIAMLSSVLRSKRAIEVLYHRDNDCRPSTNVLPPTDLLARSGEEDWVQRAVRPLEPRGHRRAVVVAQAGRLDLPPDMTRHDARRLISKAGRKKWVVDRRESYRHGHGVATYLARYVRGGPIKNQRLMRLDKEKGNVLFRVSRRGEKLQTMELPVNDFMGRVLLHVPRPGYRVVRSCGLYHHYYAEQLEACRRQLGGGHPSINDQPEAANDDTADSDDKCWVMHEDYCRICGCELEGKKIPRGPPPPELARYLGRAA